MGARRTLAVLLVTAAVTAVLVVLRGPQPSPVGAAPPPPVQPARPAPFAEVEPGLAAPAAAASTGPLRYLAVGGGPFPDSTEVSLEQNLRLVAETLAGPGALLFAGGAESRSVRVLRSGPAEDPLLVRLGDLLQPRQGRDSDYRPSVLAAGAATLAAVETRLAAALDAAGARDSVLLYFTTHGEQAEQARDNAVLLWGGGALTATRLAELHDAHPSPLRVVNASCFSGGFAELAFEGADARRGAARAPRCGLFAGTWDRETSGCDPDPERKRQEGYSLHFWHALRRLGRDGEPLSAEQVDFDGDGRVSLLEAHTRAAIAGRSIDVPTTTSQRYLRAVQRSRAPANPALLPEEQALVRQLSARLGVRSEQEARARRDRVNAELDQNDAVYTKLEAELTARHGELVARLVGRFPALDDPYHPQFAGTFTGERAAIERALDTWPEAARHAAVQRQVDALSQRYEALDLEEAQLTRLLLAYETAGLAAGLRRKGGAKLREYEALLACERWVPELTRAQPARKALPGRGDVRAEARYS